LNVEVFFVLGHDAGRGHFLLHERHAADHIFCAVQRAVAGERNDHRRGDGGGRRLLQQRGRQRDLHNRPGTRERESLGGGQRARSREHGLAGVRRRHGSVRVCVLGDLDGVVDQLVRRDICAGSPGTGNAVRNATVALPPGNYSKVQRLATGVNGNQASQVFVVNYTDGSSTRFGPGSVQCAGRAGTISLVTMRKAPHSLGRPGRTIYGAQTTRASSCSPINAIVTR